MYYIMSLTDNIWFFLYAASNVNITPKPVKTLYIDTPGGSLYYVPIVDQRLLPIIGARFQSLDEGIEMYRHYAYSRGFDILLSTQKRHCLG